MGITQEAACKKLPAKYKKTVAVQSKSVMSSANVLNRGTIELNKKSRVPSVMQETNFSTTSVCSTSTEPSSKSVASPLPASPSKILGEGCNYGAIAKSFVVKDQNDARNHPEEVSSSLSITENVETKEKNQSLLQMHDATLAVTSKAGVIEISKDLPRSSSIDKIYAVVATTNTMVKQNVNEEEASNDFQIGNFQSSKQQNNACCASVQTEPQLELFSSYQFAESTRDELSASTSSCTPSRSLEKRNDTMSTRTVTPLESLSFELVETAGQKDNAANTRNNVQSEEWLLKGEKKPTDVQHFLLRFPHTDQSLILRDEDVIEQFEYFIGITEGNFCESKTQIIEMSEHLPYHIAQLVLQPEPKMLSCINKENVCSVMESLDYLGYKYSDDFIHQLFRKIHRHRWTEEKSFTSELVHTCAYTNIGVHLMTYLRRSHGVISGLICKEGGHLIAEMSEKNADRTISLLNDICHNLCSCRPDAKDVVEFIIAATQQDALVDALAEIWDPTLWYSTEKKIITKNAMSDGPHQVGDVDVELYADSDNQGSSTTVNICMSGSSPLDGATPLSQVTNLGIYASTRGKATYVYTCFTARAKFKLKDFLLGEATFDLYPDGVKAFCPVVSGGPHMHGLQLTCRIDEKVKEFKEDYRSRYNTDIGSQRIDDIHVELKSRQFPFRGLSLYLLHNAALQSDFQFVTLFSSALQADVCEWLGTYLTPLWVQQSFPDHSYAYIAPSHLNSLPSPFLVLQHWFADARVPIDTWCSKTIMGELFQSNHFQLLMSRHFSDCLNFVKSCKKWIDSESLLLFREKLIEFVSHKPHIVGALLFDLASDTIATNPIVLPHTRHISDLLIQKGHVEQSATKVPRNRCNTHSIVTSNAPTSTSLAVRRPVQQLSCGAPKQSAQNSGAAASNCSSIGNRPLANRQTVDAEVACSPAVAPGKNKDSEAQPANRGAPSGSSCNMQVNGKQKKVLEDVLKEMDCMDWGLPDWLDSTKEGTTGKSKRCRLC